MKTKVKIYSDGSSRGNPGPGGFGTLIQYTDAGGTLHEKEISGGYSLTTNNRMELLGAISGLEALNRPCEVEMYTDSQYLVNAFEQHWIEAWTAKNWRRKGGPVMNSDLWKRLLAAMEPHEVRWNWVKGHAGNPGNERCDTLATAAADAEGLEPDPGYEPGD